MRRLKQLRYGYRRVHVLLEREGGGINTKKVVNRRAKLTPYRHPHMHAETHCCRFLDSKLNFDALGTKAGSGLGELTVIAKKGLGWGLSRRRTTQ